MGLGIVVFYIILVLTIFSFTNFKIGSKKNSIFQNFLHSITLMLLYPCELLFLYLIRKKYNYFSKIILKKLNDNGFKYHIVFGTFLFAYRDNNFKDTDIDICVYRDEFTKSQEQIIRKIGFELKEQGSLDNKIAEQSGVNKKMKIKMDIFQISRGSEFAPTFDEKNNRYARRPNEYKYILKKYNFQGINVLGPKNAEEYLSGNYGLGKKKDINYHGFYGSSSKPAIIINNANIEYKKFK